MKFKYKENENKELVAMIKKGLEKKNGYCPCLIEVSEDTKCKCKDFREKGICHCGLYIKD